MKISSIFIFIFLIISGTQAFAGGINPAYLNWLQEKQKTAGTVSAEPESGNSSAKGGKSKLSASSDRRRGLIPRRFQTGNKFILWFEENTGCSSIRFPAG